MSHFHFVLISTLILCLSWWPNANANAQSIPIDNARLSIDGPLVHGKPGLPTAWKLAQGDAQGIRAWNSPGGTAIAIGDGTTLVQTVEVPAINPKWIEQSKWKLVLAIDITGKFSNSEQPAQLDVTIEDSNAKVLATKQFEVTNDAPVSNIAKPSASASSHANNGPASRAFDGDPQTIWHSNYGKSTPTFPHHLTLDFGETRTLKGATYVPRADGGNGTLKKAALQISVDGERWQSVIQGEFKYEHKAQEQRIVLEKPVKCRAMRLLCLSEIRGAKFASCAELVPDLEGGFDGLDVATDEPAPAVQRCFLPLELDAASLPTSVNVSLSNSSLRFVIVNHLHLMLVPEQATTKMLGKANGQNGPDLLGAGSYGFEGRMVHQLPAISVISVKPGSPADRAKLKPTDLIVGINGDFLPPGNVAPGFEWFVSSHEALLGRAALNAFQDGNNGIVALDVLRDDKVIQLPIKLRLPEEIADAGFLTNPETLEILNADLIAKVVDTQQKNGGWNNDPIRTSLGGLALLSTGDSRHAERIKSAANWIMSRNAEPGPGFYWHPSFSGIFLCEYYLATGDVRALPVIERMLRMMGSTFHTSKWGTQTFGHGPKGLPYDNKSLVAVMVHVLVFEELAHRCGFESTIYETLTPYLLSAWSDPATGGHGAMGYNASYKDLGEFWSRTGLFGLKLKMSGLREDIQGPLADIMNQRHPWFRNSHAYGEPGGALGLIGLSQMNPAYFENVFEQYQWWFALAWEPGNGLHFTTPHMGAPYMESIELINNGYAIVTNIHKSQLHILGGKQRDWLDVSRIPVPISDVMILQGTDGLVRLRCRIPGPEIFYTTDGEVPNRKSNKFNSPFRIQPGSVVRAVAISGRETSQVAERGFGYDKTDWKIIAANGDSNQQRSIDRAALAIDGDQRIGWIPEQGEGVQGFPYELVIDLGQQRSVNLAGISYVFDRASASSIRIQGSNQPTKGFKNLGARDFEKFVADARVELDGSQVRYLKIIFEQPLVENSNLLMVGEIDIR